MTDLWRFYSLYTETEAGERRSKSSSIFFFFFFTSLQVVEGP